MGRSAENGWPQLVARTGEKGGHDTSRPLCKSLLALSSRGRRWWVGNAHRPSPHSYANGVVFFHDDHDHDDHDVLGALKPKSNRIWRDREIER
jgi:hypothetical protein